MSSRKFAADTLVTVNRTYPDPKFHGRQGMTLGYTSEEKRYVVVTFFKDGGSVDESRFLFDTELDSPELPATV